MKTIRYIVSMWCASSGGLLLALLLKIAIVWLAIKLNAPVNLSAAAPVVLGGSIVLAVGLFVIIKPKKVGD